MKGEPKSYIGRNVLMDELPKLFHCLEVDPVAFLHNRTVALARARITGMPHTDCICAHERRTEMNVDNQHKTIAEKAFHHNNLKLRLVYDTHFGVYTVDIYRENTRQTFSLHGIFLEEADARVVFDRVRL